MLLGMVFPYLPPPIETATDPAYSAADLSQRWRALMGPLGFGERLLRFAFVGPDRRFFKVLTDVEIPRRPTLRDIETIMSALRTLVGEMDDGTTVAFLLTRPGPGPVSRLDRQWSTMLTEVAAEFDANDESLVLVEP